MQLFGLIAIVQGMILENDLEKEMNYFVVILLILIKNRV